MPSLGLVLAVVLASTLMACQFARPPLAPGARACVQVPQAICEDILEGRVNGRAPVALTAYQIRCKVQTCDENGGEAEADLAWADGQRETFSYTWVGS